MLTRFVSSVTTLIAPDVKLGALRAGRAAIFSELTSKKEENQNLQRHQPIRLLLGLVRFYPTHDSAAGPLLINVYGASGRGGKEKSLNQLFCAIIARNEHKNLSFPVGRYREKLSEEGKKKMPGGNEVTWAIYQGQSMEMWACFVSHPPRNQLNVKSAQQKTDTESISPRKVLMDVAVGPEKFFAMF